MKVEPSGESTDPLVTPFNTSLSDLLNIVEAYRQRKLAEDIDLIENEGGVQSYEDKLKSSFKYGLSNTDDHSDRIRIFGSNKPSKDRTKTYLQICWEVLEDPILRILIISGLISLIIGATLDEHPAYGWIEGFAIIIAVCVVVNVTAVNDMQKQKKFKELKKRNRTGRVVTILRDGIWTSMHPKHLLVGDIIKVENGITIPADGILISSSQIEVVEAAMTGENDNIKKIAYDEAVKIKDEYYLANPDIIEMIRKTEEDRHHDIPSPVLLSGTNLAEGVGIMVVVAVGKNSAEGRIFDLAERSDELTPLQIKLTRVAGGVGKLGLVCAIVTVLTLYLRFIIEITTGQISWNNSEHPLLLVKFLIIGITVLVVAIPEGLPLAVTISLAYSIKKMQSENNLVRKMQACETMGGADMICSDKTGTLTQNLMTVSELWAGNTSFNIEKEPPSQGVFQAEFLHLLKESIFMNSSAYIDPIKGSQGSKTEIAMILLMKGLGHSDCIETRKAYFDRFHRIFPFSSKRKKSSIVLTTEEPKLRVHVKGASEVVASSCTKYLSLDGQAHIINEEVSKTIQNTINKMTDNALRVIALTYKNLNSQENIEDLDSNGFPEIEKSELTLIGLIGIRDPIRPEVPGAVKECQRAGITVRMVTGDNKATARAIARECNIISYDWQTVMEGKDFSIKTGGTVCKECKTKICQCPRNAKEAKNTGKTIREDVVANIESFKDIVKNLAVLARSQPDDKYTLVTGLKELGHIVAVTGDGTNDAPALSKADIGFAMGITGTEMAKESAGIILLDDNFKSIVRAVIWGRNIYDNIRAFLQFQITVNIVAVICAMVGAITIQQSPLTSVQLLWVNLIMDSFASLALATDPPTDDHLNRPPYKKTEFIIEMRMWKHILGQSTVQIILMFLMMYAGEWFLPEFGTGKSVIYNEDTNYVVSGRNYNPDGSEDYKKKFDEPDIGPSRQFTYIFNVFVLLQLTNEINARKIRDEINAFGGILRNKMFIGIWIFTFAMQVLIVSVGSYAFSCHLGGLTGEQWMICVGFSMISLAWRLVLVFIPTKVFSKVHIDENRSERIMSIRRSSLRPERISVNTK
ncbi:hypothetical protein SteCoe_33300 [Stentor coeruleus]|uniref:P-type sodium-transporting ATPase4 n=1 Tax=Stentor coeruleus TaxID=5963 RepID=A0A1R2AX29_9CILI|nr:hypothetical protein SteCoe_33300 [Stentor coeruleus]